jgi:hypothetical protein
MLTDVPLQQRIRAPIWEGFSGNKQHVTAVITNYNTGATSALVPIKTCVCINLNPACLWWYPTHRPLVWLILRGLSPIHRRVASHWSFVLGMRAGSPPRFRHQSSPSYMDPEEPSLYDDDCDTPSRLLSDQVIHMAEPWYKSGEGLPARGRSRQRPQGDDESRRKSSAHWRSWCSMMWHSGHVSHPHSWGTKIFINLKWL